MNFRRNIIEALKQFAAPAAIQRTLNVPEEFRLEWEDSFVVLAEERGNPAAIASFNRAELVALRHFNEWIWNFPSEPDPMWSRLNLDALPWPEIRARAAELVGLLEGGSKEP